MKELVVISGKGGTGKTSLTASFAALAKNAVSADCDVDAADMHLLLEPTILEQHEFKGNKIASIKTDVCIGCGMCRNYCEFGAISKSKYDSEERVFAVNEMLCEGCGLCLRMCPFKAIEWKDAVRGHYYISQTRFGPFVHAQLGYAQENSGQLVSLIRKEAKKIAQSQDKELIIVDGSPGIGCPVISSIGGCDMVLIVTEPTLSGKHDMERVFGLAKHFGVTAGVCINKYDINPEISEHIEAWAEHNGVRVLGRILYDTQITVAQTLGKTIVEHGKGAASAQVRNVWEKCLEMLDAE